MLTVKSLLVLHHSAVFIFTLLRTNKSVFGSLENRVSLMLVHVPRVVVGPNGKGEGAWGRMQSCKLQCCHMKCLNQPDSPISVLLCVLYFQRQLNRFYLYLH